MDCESDGLWGVHSLVLVKVLEHTGMQRLQVMDGTSVVGQVGGMEGRGGCGSAIWIICFI